MGCAGSKVERVHVNDHRAIPLLMALDDEMEGALLMGAVKLVIADRVRDGSIGKRITRRQDLEARERAEGIRFFHTPDEAVALIRGNGREVGSLSYGWASPDDPDPSGEYLRAARRFLKSELGAHVRGIFWDFMSLPQWPRSEMEDRLFVAALKVMADMYASLLGTMVMRHRTVPARPSHLDGEVIVLGKAAEEVVRPALEAYGALKSLHRDEQGRWRARFASHEDAERAVAAGPFQGATAIFTCHNARPYGARGWTSLETGVGTEGLSCAAYFSGLKATLERLPPKLVEIDGRAPEPLSEQYGGREGAGPRIERVRSSIKEAFFCVDTDRAIVVRLYNKFIIKFGNAMVLSGEALAGKYEGERNAAGQEEGRGTERFPDGAVYEGEWKAGQREGHGMYQYAGDVYEGEWKAGEKEGRGKFRYADGAVYDGEWKAGQMEGSCTFQLAGGDVYEGQYKIGQMEGRGTLRYADGAVYEGQYKGGKREGRGTFRDANGVYDGEYKAGQMEGHGTFQHADGAVYEGQYKAGKRDGRGTCRYSSGDVYDGQWKAGQREGRGKIRYSDGDTFEGEWKAGQEGRGTCMDANGVVYEPEYES